MANVLVILPCGHGEDGTADVGGERVEGIVVLGEGTLEGQEPAALPCILANGNVATGKGCRK